MSASAQMEPALILHVRPYQESSAIVQMLTLGQRRLAGVLRGDRGLTYAALPPDGGEIIAGAWWPQDYAGPPLVSFAAEEALSLIHI